MNCYILSVSDMSGLKILVSTNNLACAGYLVEFADGNIGRIEGVEFFSAEQYSLLSSVVDIYPAEMLYMPSPLFNGGDDDQ